MQKTKTDVDAAVIQKIVEFLRSNGAGSHVKRADLKKVSCGLLNPGTMANDDWKGIGPQERIVYGTLGKVSYPVEALAEYMASKGFVVEQKEEAAA